jgi:hypothetical protein
VLPSLVRVSPPRRQQPESLHHLKRVEETHADSNEKEIVIRKEVLICEEILDHEKIREKVHPQILGRLAKER